MTLRERLSAAWAVFKESRYASFRFMGGDLGIGPSLDSSYLDVFLLSPSVFSAVNRISEDAGSVPLIIQRGGQPAPPNDPAVQVFTKANPVESDTALWRRFWQSMELTGQAYLLTDYMARVYPQELWILRSLSVTPRLSETGIPTGYLYRRQDGREILYDPDEIYHARYPHPYDENGGASPLQAAQYPVMLEMATLKHWAQFFKKGARPSMILEKEGGIDQAVLDRLLADVERRIQGPGNAWTVAAIPNGFKSRDIGVSPREADFVESYKLIREQVLACFGVPPAVAGVLRSGGLSDANVAEQQKLYWSNTIMPKLKLLERDLEEIVLPRFGDGYTCYFDFDQVPAVQEMMLDRASRYGSLIANGMLSVNAAREQTGQPRVTGGDQVYLPISLQPVGVEKPEAEEPPESYGFGEPEEESVRGRHKFIDTPERNARRSKAAAKLDKYEKPATAEWRSALAAQRERVIKRLAAAGKSVKAPGMDDLWDDEAEMAALRGVVMRVQGRIISARGQQAMDEVSAGNEFLLTDPEVIRWLETQSASEVRKIAAATRDAIRAVLTQASDESWTLREIAEVLASLPEFGPARALRVARTETTQAYNFASLEGWKQSDVVEKVEWLSAGDEIVRESHAMVDGEEVSLGEQFSNGLEFPGDPKGPAEEVINCRCNLVPVLEPARTVRLSPSLMDALTQGNGNGKRW